MKRDSPRDRYAQHKSRAKKKGIEFEFTFEEWWKIWEPHWADRGQHKDGKVMCRTHDQGAYRSGNVRIDSPKGNNAERGMMFKCARTYLHLGAPVYKTPGAGFKSEGSWFQRPEYALMDKQQEYEWIPGE